MIDHTDTHHEACRKELPTLNGPLISTWAVTTEAMYLLGRAGGWSAQKALWKLIDRDDMVILDLDRPARTRASRLMERYRDVPMSLADATLVTVAEQLRVSRIFTLDSDFATYRYRNRGYFQLVP